MHSPAPAAAALFKPRPEQTFFPDPALDRAMGVIMALATEVYVMRDRCSRWSGCSPSAACSIVARLDAEPAADEAAAIGRRPRRVRRRTCCPRCSACRPRKESTS